MNRLIIATALLLSACGAQNTNHLYVGLLAPQAGACDGAAQAQLVMRGDAVLFTPNSGTLVLSGKKSGNKVTAAYTLLGAERKPYPLEFEGALRGSEISGIYHDARCRYRVSLHSAPF